MSVDRYRLIHGDAIASLNAMPAGVAHALCTSVPFWLQRDYKKKGAHGREETREEWASQMVAVMRASRRVLRPDATALVVVGETHTVRASGDLKLSEASLQAPYLAERLRDDDWWIKSLVIIEFDNPTPSSPTDRPRQVHQYGILLSQNANDYFWDHISSKQPGVDYDVLLRSVWSGPRENAYRSKRIKFKHTSIYPRWVPHRYLKAAVSEGGVCSKCGTPRAPKIRPSRGGSKGKSWHDHKDDAFRGNAKTTSSKDYVPAKILGWKPACSCRGATDELPLVIDPFTGTSTTGVEALSLECRYVGIDIDKRCIRLSEERLGRHLNETLATPLFDSVKAGRRQAELFQ